MKILFFSADNSYTSGAFKSMAYLAAGLKQNGHIVRVVLPFNGDGSILLEELHISHCVINSFSWIVPKNIIRVFSYLKCLLGIIKNILFVENKIKKEIIEFSPDYIHMNGSWGYCGAKVGNKLGIPVIWHIREFIEEDQNRKIIFRKYGYKLMSKSIVVICISNALKMKYQKKITNTKLTVIPNGIKIEDYIDNQHELFKDETVKMLIAGGISRSKGQYKVVKELAKSNITNIELTIVGGVSGINKYIWPLYLKIYKKSYIKYVGRQNNLTEYYKNADVFLMASKSEAWGRVTIEAMLSGCLVIGSNTGATPELIEDGITGVLFDYFNFDFIHVLCDRIVSKEQIKFIAKRGQRNAIEKYSSNLNCARIQQLYFSLCENV